MGRNVGAVQAADAFQLDRGLAAIEADVGVAAVRVDLAVLLQVGQRITFQIQLVLPRYEIRDDVLAIMLTGQELKYIGAGTTDGSAIGPSTWKYAATMPA